MRPMCPQSCHEDTGRGHGDPSPPGCWVPCWARQGPAVREESGQRREDCKTGLSNRWGREPCGPEGEQEADGAQKSALGASLTLEELFSLSLDLLSPFVKWGYFLISAQAGS